MLKDYKEAPMIRNLVHMVETKNEESLLYSRSFL